MIDLQEMATNTATAKPKGFHKRGTKTLSISGAKPSIHNNTLLVSSGVPSLDALIGKIDISKYIVNAADDV